MRAPIFTNYSSRFIIPQHLITRISVLLLTLGFFGGVWGQTYYDMSSGNYTQNFNAITTLPTNFSSVAVLSTGTIPVATKTTSASSSGLTVVASGAAIGIDATTSTQMVFLTTGSSDNSTSIATDLNLNFTGRVAGTLNYNVSTISNSTGNRVGTLRLYYSTDGTTWSELSGTNLPYSATNNVAGSGTVSVNLPSVMNNQSAVKLRFYYHNGSGGTTGNRPRIGLDNLEITSTASASTPTLNQVILTSALSSTYGSPSSGVSFTASGSNLTSNITATAQSGYQVSTDDVSYGSSVSVSSSTTVYVRFASTISAGNYNSQVAVVLSGGGASSNANASTTSSGNAVAKATPSISSTPTATAITYGQTLASSALSGGVASVAGTFTFTNPTTAPVAGTASQNVTFSPTDNTNYNTTSTTISVTVNKADQTITFSSLANNTTMDAPFSLTGSSTSGLSLSYVSSNTSVATISGSTVTIVSAGQTTITASQAGNTNFNPASDVNQILTVIVPPCTTSSQGGWNFTSATPSSTISNLTIGSLTQGNNNGTTTLISTTSASSYAGASGTNNACATAFTGALNTATSTYFQFVLEPAIGYNFSLTGISFGSRSTGTGPVAYALRSSIDNYSSDIATGTLLANSTWALETNSGLNVTGTNAVTFRLFGHSGSGSPTAGSANWRIDDLTLSVDMIITPGATAPTASPQSFCSSTSPTISSLTATGSNVQWYAASTGGSAVSSSTALQNATNYFASQTVNGCESNRTSVAVTLNADGIWKGGTTGNWNDANNWCGGVPSSSSSVVIGSGNTVTLNVSPTTVLSLTIAGSLTVPTNNQLTLTGTLTNNGTLTLENGATFKQGTSVSGGGTYNIKQNLDNCAGSGSTLTGRYWYLGSPVTSLRETSFGNTDALNKVWSFTNGAYTAIADGATLSPTTGYVHRRGSNALPLTFTGTNLYAEDVTLSLSNNAGTYGGWHLIANPYTAYLDWHQVYNASNALSSAISPSYYIRSFNSTGNDVNALITYNSSTGLESNTSSLSLTSAQAQYIAPMQAIWVKVNPTTPLSATAGQLRLERAFTSHQAGNVGLKSSTIFPTLARVNLVDGARFDQLLVYMNPDMTNGVDQYDSEKMFVTGAPQLYTMAAGKKLVMNGLKNNKSKISVPLYLELPESKVYQLSLAEYILEDGLILLEDKQEGTIQDFTIHDVYAFYATSGVLQNRFVLHFFKSDNGITAQGPSNTWVEEQEAINEGGNILVNSNGRGKVTIQQDIDQSPTAKGSVVVRDAAGREVWKGQLSGSATTLELDTPSGIYFVEVELNGKVEMKKIFVQQ